MYKNIIKPLADILIGILALLLLWPLLILVAVAIKIDSSGPAFFLQPRLGKNGKVFKIIKFRSMITKQADLNKSDKLYENDPRITKVGAFIRKTSIDELPQIFNIIKGEMSFIGPRPPVVHFPKKIDEYNDFEKQRFLVKPGISGLAQVRCREVHDWDINIPIDVEYVHNQSFMFDLKLFFASFLMFFKTDNIYRKA
ncbi:MAG: sugar transferase [Lentimicrobiaceae bacterium]|nr:sugar transferase [Lentimicrobiaceae bacterium]MDD4598294.1 sugar transferase [Lentimicrobiaceae bacterium]